MIPKIVIQHIDNRSHLSIEVDCGFVLKEFSSDNSFDSFFDKYSDNSFDKEVYNPSIHIFSGSREKVEDVSNYLVRYWNGDNKTAKDANKRINQARDGCLFDSTIEYKKRLQILVQQWADDLKDTLENEK